MRSGSNIILGCLNKESVVKDDVIFIRNRDATPIPILKRQRSQLSTGGRKEKKKLKISTMSLSLKKEDKKEDSKEKDLEDNRLHKRINS